MPDPTVLVMLVVLVGIAAALAVSSRNRRAAIEQRRLADLEAVRHTADEDVTRYGEELQRLDVDVAGHALDAATQQDYQRALDSYEDAKAAVAAVQSPDEIRHVTTVLEDGRYAVACVRARLHGEPLPQRRPPCFFNPQHGPSAANVMWTQPGRGTRSVPACAQDAARVANLEAPEVRKVKIGSRTIPYWEAGAAYLPYAEGYFASAAVMMWAFQPAPTWGGGHSGGFDGGGFDGGGFDGGGFDSGGGYDGGGGGDGSG